MTRYIIADRYQGYVQFDVTADTLEAAIDAAMPHMAGKIVIVDRMAPAGWDVYEVADTFVPPLVAYGMRDSDEYQTAGLVARV